MIISTHSMMIYWDDCLNQKGYKVEKPGIQLKSIPIGIQFLNFIKVNVNYSFPPGVVNSFLWWSWTKRADN